MQFGDKSAVEGFQSITNLILTAVQQAIDGNQAVRDLVPDAGHLWQYVDVRPTHSEYLQWERERIAEHGEGTQLRLNHTDGYIDGFMGSAHGRRRAFAIAAIHRAFIGKTGADFPLKAYKECLPVPSMTALGGLATNRKISIEKKHEPRLCHRRPGLKPRVVCLVERTCLMATPAWPTPIRELLSKLNSSRPPCFVADSALSCRWPRAAVTKYTTSPRRYFARKLRGGLRCSGADPTGRDSPTAQSRSGVACR